MEALSAAARKIFDVGITLFTADERHVPSENVSRGGISLTLRSPSA